MQSFLGSFLLVAASEMGDKTQLLALVLASRFKKPFTIMAGILVATLANHGIASALGDWVSLHVSPQVLKYSLAALFVGFGLWILIPDKEDETQPSSHFGAFATTAITFFLAEMGDKTQLATIALGAKYQDIVMVTLGTTSGMLVADGLAVFLGEKLARKIPLKTLRIFACVLFLLFGAGILYGF